MLTGGETEEACEGSSYGLYVDGDVYVNDGTLRASGGNVLNETGESHGFHVVYNSSTATGGTLTQTGGTLKAYSGKTAYDGASNRESSSIGVYVEVAPTFTGGTTEIKAGSSDGQNHNVYGMYVADTNPANSVTLGKYDKTSKASMTVSTYRSVGGNCVGFAIAEGIAVNAYFGKIDVSAGGQTSGSEEVVNVIGMKAQGNVNVAGATLNVSSGMTYGSNISVSVDLCTTGSVNATEGQLNANGSLSESSSICINNASKIIAAGGVITAKVYNSASCTGIVADEIDVLGGGIVVNDVTTTTTPNNFTGIKCAGTLNFGDTSANAYQGSLAVNKADAISSSVSIDNLGTSASTTVHANFKGDITAVSGNVSAENGKTAALNTTAFNVESGSNATVNLTSGSAMQLNGNSYAVYSNGNISVNGATITLNTGNTGYHSTALASGTFGIYSTGKVNVAGSTFTVNCGSTAANADSKQMYGIYSSYAGDDSAAITIGDGAVSGTNVAINTICSGQSDGGDNVGIYSTNGLSVNKATVNVSVGGATSATCYQDTKFAGIYGGNSNTDKDVSVINSTVKVTSGTVSGADYINVYGIAGYNVEFDGSTITTDMGAITNTSTSGTSTLNGIKAFAKLTSSESTVNAYNDVVAGNDSSATIDDAAIDAKEAVIPSGTINAGVYSASTSQNACAVNVSETLTFGSTSNTPTLNINQDVAGRTVAKSNGNNYGLVIGSACTSASFMSGAINVASGDSISGKSIAVNSATSTSVQFTNTTVAAVAGNTGTNNADAAVAIKFASNPTINSGSLKMTAGLLADGTTFGIALIAPSDFEPGSGYAIKNSIKETGTGNFRQANTEHPLEIKKINILSLGETEVSDPTGKGAWA